MNFKAFATVFLTLLAVNASTQTPVQSDDVKDIIVIVINGILDVTQKLLNKADSVIDDWDSHDEEIRQKVVDAAVNLASDLNAIILEIIDELKYGATDDGKAVLECIVAEEKSTDAAIKSLATDVANCLGKQHNAVITEVRAIQKQLSKLQSDVEEHVDTLSSCSDGEAECLLSFVNSIVQTAMTIPSNVVKDVKDVIALVKTIIKGLNTCDLLPEVGSSIQNIFNEAVVCIKA